MRNICGPMLLACWMASAASAKTDRFVWTNSPEPAAPFTNWTTAAHTIQAAIDVCESGDAVVVTDGVYAAGGRAAPGLALTNRVLITHAIRVGSVNGPKWTTIRGAGELGPAGVRCAFLTNGAALLGFRLEQGRTCLTTNFADADRSGGGALLYGSRLADCHVVSNAAADFGGGLAGFGGSIVTGCVLTMNAAMDGGGAYLEDGGAFDVAFRDNVASPGYGGGLYLRRGGATNCTVLRNNGYWGGGLLADGAEVVGLVAVSNVAVAGAGVAAAESTLAGCRLADNSAMDRGGGAYLVQSSLADSIVSNNNLAWQQEAEPLPGHGAGIACDFSWVQNCDVVANWGNHPEDVGGGLASSGDDFFPSQIVDCSIRGNSAGDGGGLYVFSNSFCLLSSQGSTLEFRDNVASNCGGGICVDTQAVLLADGPLVVVANGASNGGGWAARSGAQVHVEGAEDAMPLVQDNMALDSGGGLFAADAATWIALRAVQFHNNVAQGAGSFSGGGGIALRAGAELGATNLVFLHNRCPQGHGGALLLHDSTAFLSSTAPAHPALASPRTQFLDNLATNQNGGGLYAYGSLFSIQNAAFFGNAARRGAAIHVDSGSRGRLDNVILAGNSAALVGGGLRAYEGAAADAACELRHCTLCDNAPDGVGRGGAAAVSLTNCIVVGNGATNLSPGCTAAYCDVGGGYAGAGNIDADPGFRDPAARDFHLTIDSTGTVADAGIYSEVTNDCVIRSRPLSDGYDMGAFEYNAAYDDSDDDGIPDGWEAVRGLNPRDAADGPAHGDADGKTNFEEYLADTDPLDETQYFHLTDCSYNPARPDRGIFVGFTSSSNRLYDLHSVPVVSNGCAWTAMAGKTNYKGGGSYDGFNDTNAPFNGVIRSYRVAVRPIPE